MNRKRKKDKWLESEEDRNLRAREWEMNSGGEWKRKE